VRFVHTNMAKNKMQPHTVNAQAGMQHSAESWGERLPTLPKRYYSLLLSDATLRITGFEAMGPRCLFGVLCGWAWASVGMNRASH
jgi:hypothetical protein